MKLRKRDYSERTIVVFSFLKYVSSNSFRNFKKRTCSSLKERIQYFHENRKIKKIEYVTQIYFKNMHEGHIEVLKEYL